MLRAERVGRARWVVCAGVLVGVGGGVGAGCGWSDPESDAAPRPDEPLVIEAPAPEVGEPINWDQPVQSSGFYGGNNWPKACELMSDGEIASVLPQATVAERVAGDQEFDLIGLGGSGGNITAFGTECTIDLDIPEAGLPHLPDAELGPRITVTIDAAGSSGVVSRNFNPTGERLTTTAGECYDGSFEVVCRLDRMAFRVATVLPVQYRDDEGWTNRYEVDGEPTTFESDGRPLRDETEQRKEDDFLRRSLDIRLAELVLAKR